MVQRNTPRSSSSADSSDLDRLPADTISPSQMAGQAEWEALIRAAGNTLTNEQLAVLTLHDVDGIPLKEIARQLGASAVEVARQYLVGEAALRDSGVVLHESATDPQATRPQVRLACAMERLPPGERRAVLLKHLEEYTMEEAAEALRTTPAAVGSAVYRGMKALRALLADPTSDGDRSHVGHG
jgi:DNA-directed RNA polymerase specialized sigma24 family protein